MKEHILLNNRKFYLDDIKAENYEPAEISPFEMATLNFCRDWLNGKASFSITTSGSTGKPQAIQVDASLMKASARKTIVVLDLKPGDNALVCLNTSFIAGMMMLARSLEGKMQIIASDPSSNPLLGLAPIKIDFTAIVPLQLRRILEEPSTKKYLETIKNVIVGGAPLSSRLEGFLKDFDNNIYQTYGMTETVSHIALRKISGKNPEPYYTILNDVSIKPDARGCLMIKSDVTRNEWITTNDLVEIIDEKRFAWLGRVDHVINSGGMKFHPEKLEKKIEEVFVQNSITRRFFVYGLPHDQLGEAIALFIEGARSEDMLLALKKDLPKHLNNYELPKEIRFIEKFEETATGKVKRKSMNNDQGTINNDQ